jgi:hypothetical protein
MMILNYSNRCVSVRMIMSTIAAEDWALKIGKRGRFYRFIASEPCSSLASSSDKLTLLRMSTLQDDAEVTQNWIKLIFSPSHTLRQSKEIFTWLRSGSCAWLSALPINEHSQLQFTSLPAVMAAAGELAVEDYQAALDSCSDEPARKDMQLLLNPGWDKDLDALTAAAQRFSGVGDGDSKPKIALARGVANWAVKAAEAVATLTRKPAIAAVLSPDFPSRSIAVPPSQPDAQVAPVQTSASIVTTLRARRAASRAASSANDGSTASAPTLSVGSNKSPNAVAADGSNQPAILAGDGFDIIEPPTPRSATGREEVVDLTGNASANSKSEFSPAKPARDSAAASSAAPLPVVAGRAVDWRPIDAPMTQQEEEANTKLLHVLPTKGGNKPAIAGWDHPHAPQKFATRHKCIRKTRIARAASSSLQGDQYKGSRFLQQQQLILVPHGGRVMPLAILAFNSNGKQWKVVGVEPDVMLQDPLAAAKAAISVQVHGITHFSPLKLLTHLKHGAGTKTKWETCLQAWLEADLVSTS